MKNVFPALLASTLLSSCPSMPTPSGCEPRTSSCQEDRPYVCSGTQRWTPVGDTTCAAVGAVCCATADAVHACVPQSACVGE